SRPCSPNHWRRACRVAWCSDRAASRSLPGSCGASDQAVVELGELLVAVELDDDPAALARSGQRDLRAEPPPEIVLDALEVRIQLACRGCGGCDLRFAKPADQLLGLANGERLLDDRVGHRRLLVDGQAGDGAGMALADPLLDEGVLDARIEVEQAEGVRDRGLRSADPARDLLVGEPELGDQRL